MIKVFAMLLMLVDHIGAILLSDLWILRLIGRLSMPLFAYGVARGYYYTSLKGDVRRTGRYIYRMAGLAVASQVPYLAMHGWDIKIGWNICTTWVLSLLVLLIMDCSKGVRRIAYFICIVGVILLLLPEFGIFGVFLPVLFYYCYFDKKYDTYKLLVLMIALWAVYVVLTKGSALTQAFSFMALPLIAVLRKVDDKISVPKWFSYAFYPIHIVILLLVERMV